MTTILLVAHHKSLRQSLRDWLALDLPQCRVIEAMDTTTAIELAQNNTMHAIIIDIDIPQGNGFDILRCVRVAAPDAQIVAFGLDETETKRARVIEAGATTYLPKSRVQTELISTLKSAFGIVNSTPSDCSGGHYE